MAKWDLSKLDTRSLAELQVETTVDNPPHYLKGTKECIDAMEATVEGAKVPPHQAHLWQTALKYLWRWPWKGNGVEDLRKEVWYLNCLISRIEREQS